MRVRVARDLIGYKGTVAGVPIRHRTPQDGPCHRPTHVVGGSTASVFSAPCGTQIPHRLNERKPTASHSGSSRLVWLVLVLNTRG